MAENPRLRLLRLPDDAVLEVIRNFCLMDKFNFSLLSSRSRNFIRLAHSQLPEAYRTSVSSVIASETSLKIAIENRSPFQLKDELCVSFITVLPLTIAPHRYNTLYRDRLNIWNNFGPTVQLWVEHLLWIMNKSSMKRLTFCGLPWSDNMESVRNTFERHIELEFYLNTSNADARALLSIFSPVKKLILPYQCFHERMDFDRLLAQNFDSLSLGVRLNLDEILSTNAVCLKVEKLRDVNLNRLVKLWLARRTNPRLECMILINDTMDIDGIMRGIPNQEVTEPITFNKGRDRYEYKNGRDEITVFHGRTIQRSDGKKATICVEREFGPQGFALFFQFFVW